MTRFNVTNTTGNAMVVAGTRIEPRSEVELELDEEVLERVEASSRLQAERVQSFECDDCEKSFDSERGLQTHRTQIHGGEDE